jgi:hypothetical protein
MTAPFHILPIQLSFVILPPVHTNSDLLNASANSEIEIIFATSRGDQ